MSTQKRASLILSEKMSGFGRLEVLWGAASTGLSACLYLLDLGTTISALVTYYFYKYKCPQVAQLPPPPFRHDRICRIIRSNPSLYTVCAAFWACLASLLVAHPINAFMFWNSLPAHQHPFRLAYFMPLIHLYRLIQLLRHGFNLKALQELQKRQREVVSLYNALGVAMETFPQFTIQAVVAVRLGESLSGSADVRVQAQRVPTTLVISLVASLASGLYNSGMAGSLLMGAHVPCAKRVCVALLVGLQTGALMVSKSMNIAAFFQFYDGLSIILCLYLSIEITLTWIVIRISYQNSYHDHHQSKTCFDLVHSFLYTIFVRSTSPLYVSMKEGRSSCLLILSTIIPILVDIMGLAFVLIVPGHFIERESPCHPLKITKANEQWNKYLTCKVFIGAIFCSLLVVIFTTLIFMWLMKDESNANMVHDANSTTNIAQIETTSLIETSCVRKESLHQLSVPTLYGLILVMAMVLFIKRTQTQCIIKGSFKKYY